MVLIGFNYLETLGEQISSFKRGRQENDDCKEKIVQFTCLNSKVKKKKPGFFDSFIEQKIEKILAQQTGLFEITRILLKEL